MVWNGVDKAGGLQGSRGNARRAGMARRIGIFLLLSVVVCSVGCSGKRPPPPQMKLYVETDQSINNGQLFYLLLRAVTDKQFLTESYQTVAGVVFADPPDKTVIGSHVILPGLYQEFKVIQPEEGPVAFYFFFTEPGDQWKKLIEQPLAKAYNVKIKGDGISINPKKSAWKKILWPFGS
ncbi:MAG: hypothetical protein LLG06_13555 [Desulfobacteraceae bacterium]|nr:hypothetical protein [Desulfobacteraceae bacterium]